MESRGSGFLPYHLAEGRILRRIQCCARSHVRLGPWRNLLHYRSEDVFQRAKTIAGDRGIDAIIDNIGPSNGVDNLALLGPEGGLACIAGIPDLSVVPDLPYSISIHDIGLGGVMASPAFRRRQEDLSRMATELMTLVQVGKIRPTVAEQITLEAIPKALERLAEGHVRGKIVARVES